MKKSTTALKPPDARNPLMNVSAVSMVALSGRNSGAGCSLESMVCRVYALLCHCVAEMRPDHPMAPSTGASNTPAAASTLDSTNFCVGMESSRSHRAAPVLMESPALPSPQNCKVGNGLDHILNVEL